MYVLGYHVMKKVTVSLAVSVEHRKVTDEWTDRIAKFLSRISVVTRDKMKTKIIIF